jgi:S-(hydroxymethyl)glutathione dehydrogenase/alcohol dehydrogenase
MSSTVGKPIECKAMVARAAKQPLSLETITVDPPRAGEVRVKVIANALCHTDIYTCKQARTVEVIHFISFVICHL